MGTVEQEAKEVDPDEAGRLERIAQKPLLEQCYNLHDFEAVARRIMKRTAWGYYSSAADDEIVRHTSPRRRRQMNTHTHTERGVELTPSRP